MEAIYSIVACYIVCYRTTKVSAEIRNFGATCLCFQFSASRKLSLSYVLLHAREFENGQRAEGTGTRRIGGICLHALW